MSIKIRQRKSGPKTKEAACFLQLDKKVPTYLTE